MRLRHTMRSMIQDVFGIKDFQTRLPELARKISETGGHFLVTKRSKPAMVAIPFEDYKEIEDILLELNSPKLKKEIKKARGDYKKGKVHNFDEVTKNKDVK